MALLVVTIAQRFESLNQGVCIDVQTGGSGRGITDIVVAHDFVPYLD